MKNEEIIKALNWRYATKVFDKTKKISDEDLHVLNESLRLAASSFGLQPWKFILVNDEATRQKLREHSWGQSQVTDASHYVVLTYLTELDEEYVEKFVQSIAEQRNVERESLQGYFDVMKAALIDGPRSKTIPEWSQRQTYIAMGQLLMTAAIQGIDTCAIEGIVPEEYDKILGLEGTKYKTLGTVALGYRSDEDKYKDLEKVRFSFDEVFKVI
ncbi:NAD(P)H-dependent oxidoreductase [Halobacteriovorax sp. RT-2-4]|uniref:NAD(P)H-dependent oxidoreductase n=1 Tax=unclassified Halobacteriovorax TaxID=2639665 RepID=UPI00399AD4CA